MCDRCLDSILRCKSAGLVGRLELGYTGIVVMIFTLWVGV